jgi:hypothetical protein
LPFKGIRPLRRLSAIRKNIAEEIPYGIYIIYTLYIIYRYSNIYIAIATVAISTMVYISPSLRPCSNCAAAPQEPGAAAAAGRSPGRAAPRAPPGLQIARRAARLYVFFGPEDNIQGNEHAPA